MLVWQLVANFVCLLFGAGYTVYSGFIRTCGENSVDGKKEDESGETELKQ